VDSDFKLPKTLGVSNYMQVVVIVIIKGIEIYGVGIFLQICVKFVTSSLDQEIIQHRFCYLSIRFMKFYKVLCINHSFEWFYKLLKKILCFWISNWKQQQIKLLIGQRRSHTKHLFLWDYKGRVLQNGVKLFAADFFGELNDLKWTHPVLLILGQKFFFLLISYQTS